jgi:dTDP-4-amino-4,6-dideoxygalactose transaminase
MLGIEKRSLYNGPKSDVAHPTVPFNRPTVARSQLQRIDEALRSGSTAGNGPFTKIVEKRLSELHKGAPVLLTPSCTAALEMTALLMDLQRGDEIIVPAFTFVSSANAFAMFGANIRFADVRADTWTMDLAHAEQLLTDRTKAIVLVHYSGAAPDVQAFADMCSARGIVLIEDNAHGLFGEINGKPLGTFGQFSTLSFHETKNISSGEGGALVVNDHAFASRAEIIREKGTDRSKFLRGQVDKYTWVARGSSYLMNEVTAASLHAQLEDAEVVQQRRKTAWNRYRLELQEWRASLLVAGHDPGPSNPFHLFALRFEKPEHRNAFLSHCQAKDVLSVFHYTSPMGLTMRNNGLQCPVTTWVSERMARLPLFSDMHEAEADRVIDVVRSFKVD